MIGYPTKRKAYIQTESKPSTKRGMNLEEDLNLTNQYYLDLDMANIHKKPTPITIVKVDYPIRSKSKITEAYFKIPSTTDYNGVYKHRAIDFEAKETQSKTSFTLSNIHLHQIQHMESVAKHGAISFLIIRFTSLDETYLLYIDKFIEFTNNHNRKSIPIDWLRQNAYLIPYSLTPPIHYLKIIDSTYFKE